MKRADGFLLIEALTALAVLAASILALGEALSSSRLLAARKRRLESIEACAEAKLAQTLMGPGAPGLPCDPALRVEMDSALPEGDVEQVTWLLSADGGAQERFTMVRYAK